jgi:bacterioferritin-associated ferredoxin
MMIVCSCNVLSETQVRETVNAAAARTAGEVYRCLGCSPRCGRCVRTIRAIMDDALGRPCDLCEDACAAPLTPAE